MEHWIRVILKYKGEFDNYSTYVWGDERLIYIRRNNVGLQELRENIKHILEAESIDEDYRIYFLSISGMGRHIRSVLATDADFQRLCNFESEPTVYLIQHGDAKGSTGFLNVLTSNWFDEGTSESSRQPIVQDLNDMPTCEGGNGDGGTLNVSIQMNEEADASLDQDSDDDEEADMNFTSSLINFTLADFNEWINREGGLSALVSSLVPTHPLPNHILQIESEGDQTTNWLLPLMPIDTSDDPLLEDIEKILDEELRVEAEFSTKQKLTIAVSLWNMEHRSEFAVARSSKYRLEYRCRFGEGCPFECRAYCRNGIWGVHKFVGHHTCNRDFGSLRQRSVRSLGVAAYFAKSMCRRGTVLKPKEIMVILKESYGITTNYSVALRARNLALSMIYGGQNNSFQVLLKYLEVLERCNPGTMTSLEVATDNRFKHCFVALGVCRVAFSSSLRQVIVIDATHLKGRSEGVMFVAVTKDGNEQIFPLAVGIGPIENDESWNWFLMRLREAFGCSEHLCIVSDQHISIANAAQAVFPENYHGLCFYHLQNKLATFGKHVARLFHRAANAYRTDVHNKALMQISTNYPSAHDRLIQVGVHRWARSMCPGRRYNFMTSNAAEVFNSRMLEARRLPICSLLEAFRRCVEKWFDARRALHFNREDDLTTITYTKLRPLVEISETYVVTRISSTAYKIDDGKRSWSVDLNVHNCTCNEFQSDLMPCSHAIAVIRVAGGQDFYNYVA